MSKKKEEKSYTRKNRPKGVSKKEWDKARKSEGLDPKAKFFKDPEPERRKKAALAKIATDPKVDLKQSILTKAQQGKNWNQIASELDKEKIDISTGSDADLLLNQVFKGSNLEGGIQERVKKDKAAGKSWSDIVGGMKNSEINTDRGGYVDQLLTKEFNGDQGLHDLRMQTDEKYKTFNNNLNAANESAAKAQEEYKQQRLGRAGNAVADFYSGLGGKIANKFNEHKAQYEEQKKKPFLQKLKEATVRGIQGPVKTQTALDWTVRPVTRTAASTMLELTGQKEADPNIMGVAGRQIFGKAPIQSYSEGGRQIGEGFGVKNPLAQAGIATGLIALDYLGYKAGNKKKLAQQAADMVENKVKKEVVEQAPQFTTRKLATQQGDDMKKAVGEFLTGKKPQVTQVADDLTQQAKKYKSAEEFVKAQPKARLQIINERGGTAEIERIDSSVKGGGTSSIGKYFEENPNIKNLVGSAEPESYGFWEKIGAKMDKAYNVGEPEELRNFSLSRNDFFNQSKYQTKSQLTDIWNKANKVGQEIGEQTGQIFGPTTRRSGVKDTIQKSPIYSSTFKKKAEKFLPDYEKMNLNNLDDYAIKKVDENMDGALEYISSFTSKEKDALDKVLKTGGIEEAAVAARLIEKLDEAGRHAEATIIVDNLREAFTRAGQFSNVAKLLGSYSPARVRANLQKTLEVANKNLLKGQKPITIADDEIKYAIDLAKQIQESKDPALKRELISVLDEFMSSKKRTGIDEYLESGQTISQLLRPKTLLTRNPLGNELMWRINRATKYVSSPIDWAKSKLTGRARTITFRDGQPGIWKRFYGGMQDDGLEKGFKEVFNTPFWKGFREGGAAAWKGRTLQGDKYGVSHNVFKSKKNPMHWAEKALGAALQSFDNAAYQRAYNSKIGELAYLKALNSGKKGNALNVAMQEFAQNMDTNMAKMADDYGKYITYQDQNVLSRGLGNIKRGLNFGKKFGLGSLSTKYTQVPGALTMRAIEYSPAGFLKSFGEIAMPLMKQGGKINDAQVIESLSKAIVGTLGFSGLGYYLYDAGILTGKADKDADKLASERQAGGGPYKVNLSALKRFVMSGGDKEEAKRRDGDRLYSYDWAQPVAASIQMGVGFNQRMDEAREKDEKYGLAKSAGAGADAFMSGLTAGVASIADQPVMSGISGLFSGYGGTPGDRLTEGVTRTLETLPSSFVPGALTDVNSIADYGTIRETRASSGTEEMYNKFAAKVPFLAQTLPKRIGTTGEEIQRFEKTNNIFVKAFNVLLNPGFTTKYKENQEFNLVNDIYQSSGETKQYPREAKRFVDIVQNGEKKRIEFGSEDIVKMQDFIGDRTKDVLTKLSKEEWFMEMKPEEQAEYISDRMTEIGKQSEVELYNADKDNNYKTTEEINKDIELDGKFHNLENAYNKNIDNYYDEYNKLTKEERADYKTWFASKANKERGETLEARTKREYDELFQGDDLSKKYEAMRKIIDIKKEGTVARYKEYESLYAKELFEKFKSGNYNKKEVAIALVDKEISKKIKTLAKEAKMTNEELDIYRKGVDNMERAEAIAKRAKEMSPEQQKEFYISLYSKGILTEEIANQIALIQKNR